MNRSVVLHSEVDGDAPADEKDTLVQMEAVSDALRELGYDPEPIPFSLNLESVSRKLQSIRPRFVFNLVESVNGQDRLVYLAPALLDTLNLPYTGSSTEAIFLTSNKLVAKRVMRAAGALTPAAYTRRTLNDTLPEPGLYIVKSVWEHASIGLDQNSVISIEDPTALGRELIRLSGRFRGESFAEQFIDGREFNLSLLTDSGRPQVLPAAEIRFDTIPPGQHRIVDYRSKWAPHSEEYLQTPRSFEFSKHDAHLLEKLRATAITCWEIFGLRGYARVDFRVDRSGNPYILEVNANPCLSPDSGFAAAADRGGISFVSAVERIVDGAGIT